jgi:hypothetical protein
LGSELLEVSVHRELRKVVEGELWEQSSVKGAWKMVPLLVTLKGVRGRLV